MSNARCVGVVSKPDKTRDVSHRKGHTKTVLRKKMTRIAASPQRQIINPTPTSGNKVCTHKTNIPSSVRVTVQNPRFILDPVSHPTHINQTQHLFVTPPQSNICDQCLTHSVLIPCACVCPPFSAITLATPAVVA